MSSPTRPKMLVAVSTVILAALTQSAVSAGTASTGSAGKASAPYCGITWGSLPKSGGQWSPAPLLATRTGRHDCYDRVVFELTGPANGYEVQYSSAPSPWLNSAGGAVLNVKLLAPANYPTDQPTYPYGPGDHVADVSGYRTLRDVVWSGTFDSGSYDTSFTVFEVGVRARLPFRVFVLSGPDSHSRIVVDVAHRW